MIRYLQITLTQIFLRQILQVFQILKGVLNGESEGQTIDHVGESIEQATRGSGQFSQECNIILNNIYELLLGKYDQSFIKAVETGWSYGYDKFEGELGARGELGGRGSWVGGMRGLPWQSDLDSVALSNL